MISLIMSLAGAVLPKMFDVIDKAITNKDEASRIKSELQMAMMAVEAKELEAATSIIVAEAQGASAAQRNWRPHLMYLIMGLLVFNGAVVPLVNVLADVELPILDAWQAIPGQMWTLLQIGLGGYVAGRSMEKIAKTVAPNIKWNSPRSSPQE